jgi:hypothetical protein
MAKIRIPKEIEGMSRIFKRLRFSAVLIFVDGTERERADGCGQATGANQFANLRHTPGLHRDRQTAPSQFQFFVLTNCGRNRISFANPADWLD